MTGLGFTALPLWRQGSVAVMHLRVLNYDCGTGGGRGVLLLAAGFGYAACRYNRWMRLRVCISRNALGFRAHGDFSWSYFLVRWRGVVYHCSAGRAESSADVVECAVVLVAFELVGGNSPSEN